MISAIAGPDHNEITIASNIPIGATYTLVYASSDGVNFIPVYSVGENGANSFVLGGLGINQAYYFYAVAYAGTRQKQSGISQVALNGDQNAGATFCTAKKGEPVNVMNGNMYLQQIDYNLPGIGESVNLTRAYNGMIQFAGLFGYG